MNVPSGGSRCFQDLLQLWNVKWSYALSERWVPREQSWICWSKVKLNKDTKSGFFCVFLHTPSLISTFNKLLLFLIIITPLLPNQPNKMNKDNEKEHCTERLALQDWLLVLNKETELKLFLKLCLGCQPSSENQASEAKAAGANKWKGKTWMLRRGLHLDRAVFFIVDQSLSLHFMVVYCDLHHATDILWDSPLRAFWISGNLLMTLKKDFRSSVAESLEALSGCNFYVQDWRPQ